MAALTWTITGNGAASGVALAAASKVVSVAGTLDGGFVSIEVAPTSGATYVPMRSSHDTVGQAGATTGAFTLELPSGWFVRPVVSRAGDAPSINIAIE